MFFVLGYCAHTPCLRILSEIYYYHSIMVTIYSTPVCVYCRMAKDYFRAHNVPFQEINVQGDEAKIAEMVQKSHQRGVPVIEIDNQIIVGFDRARIAELLKLPS